MCAGDPRRGRAGGRADRGRRGGRRARRDPGLGRRRRRRSTTWRPGGRSATCRRRLVCANAYLGARPIAEGCADGARVVVTGRVADASLTLGPAAAHFGWAWDDWDRLAGASVAGHVIECGAQATGGSGTAGTRSPTSPASATRSPRSPTTARRVITKPEGTGGLVSRRHRRRAARLRDRRPGALPDARRGRRPDDRPPRAGRPRPRRASTGAEGRPPSDTLKVAAVYRDGWTASGMLAVVGRGAEAKARAAGRIVLDRVTRAGFDAGRFARRVPRGGGRRAGRLAAGRPAVRGGPAGHRPRPEARGGRAVLPRVRPAGDVGAARDRRLRHGPAVAPAGVRLLADAGPPGAGRGACDGPDGRRNGRGAHDDDARPDDATVRLGDLAHARSGDKGNRANIGVVAFDADVLSLGSAST